jgi:hypothetical protein
LYCTDKMRCFTKTFSVENNELVDFNLG